MSADELVKRVRSEKSHIEGSRIPEQYLQQLQDMGLWLCTAAECFNCGVRVYKPISAGGNGISNYSPAPVVALKNDLDGSLDEQLSPDSDAPTLVFFQDTDEKWVVHAVDGAGGMLPSDFFDTWDTAEEALEDIRQFYFGDPARMNLKASSRRQVEEIHQG